MEGVERYKVKLSEHNDEWKLEYLKVKKEIERIWGDNVLDIQHVGSTAVYGICTKPILDVAVRLQDIRSMNIDDMKRIGYDYCGSQHGNYNYQLYVLRGENQISLRHIHCYDKCDEGFDQLVGFRDYLRMHMQAAKEYERLKKELAKKYPDDRKSYTRGKEKFIQNILLKL